MEEQIDRDSLTDEAIQLLRLVPSGYIPLPHQVGGHRHIDGKPGVYMYMYMNVIHCSDVCGVCVYMLAHVCTHRLLLSVHP